jgi:hypothetical protein
MQGRLDAEREAKREHAENGGAVGGLAGSRRRTSYDEGHTHDQ